MTVYWRPHREVHPEPAPDQDFVAYDEARGGRIGRVYLMRHSEQRGRWSP